ncbi:MAG: 1-acyl-sn-glycerol-3-phosphate acyltransferase [Planctomycetes bacterium]|nr:1-acyl-sn-glycerol-3-phosphate acyltransferase [Planctomycetota bacterium]
MRIDKSFKKRFLFYLATAGIHLVTAPIFRNLHGTEHLPAGGYIIASNHRSLIDGLLLVNEFNRVRQRAMHMIAYKEPFDHWFYGKLLRITGCIPFDRGDPKSRLEVLRLAISFLKQGEPVGIFPEAHLSQTNTMRRGRIGVGLLALESGAPIVPVGIRNSEKVLEPGTGRFRLGTRATLEIGPPLDFSHLREEFFNGSQEARAHAVGEVVLQTMLAIAKISGQDYPYSKLRTRRRKRKA